MTPQEAAALLQARDHILILTHRRPDGDTIGCAAGLCAALRQRIRNQPAALSQPDLPFDVTDQIDTVGSGGAAEPVLEGREHDRQLSPCSPWLHPLEERRWNDFF